jgi:hypothetical protein
MKYVLLSGVDKIVAVEWIGTSEERGEKLLEIKKEWLGELMPGEGIKYEDGKWWNGNGKWYTLLEYEDGEEKRMEEKVRKMKDIERFEWMEFDEVLALFR